TYNSQDVTTATTVTASLAAGDFTAGSGTLASNYTLPTTASGAGTITQAAPTFSGLTASQTITYGAATIDVAGTLSSPTAIPAGQDVTVTINGAGTTAVVVGADGSFTTTIDPASLPASATAYTIAYAYAGDANFLLASDNTTTLTVNT
ncbi:MAG: hypothetical protein WBX00_24805, partial [Isosphaeraceae bacterium]